MDEAKRQALEAAGFKFTTVAEWLGLTPEEEREIEKKIVIFEELKKSRPQSKGRDKPNLPDQ